MSGSKELGPDRVSAGQRLKEIFLGVTPRDRRNGWRSPSTTKLELHL